MRSFAKKEGEVKWCNKIIMSFEGSSYDVVVVRGGPAGATLGYMLSNFGFEVLIVDKDTFPRRKLC